MSIEKLPSGKYRAVVRHAGAKRASEVVATVAEARMLEAKLKLAMGGSAAPRERHTVGEVVSGYIADGASRLSPGSIDFYRKGLAALPESFRNRQREIARRRDAIRATLDEADQAAAWSAGAVLTLEQASSDVPAITALAAEATAVGTAKKSAPAHGLTPRELEIVMYLAQRPARHSPVRSPSGHRRRRRHAAAQRRP